MQLDLAEAAAERHVRPRRQPGLTGEEDHLVLEQQVVDQREALVGERVEVDAVDLGAQRAGDEPDLGRDGCGHR